jgi:hypothetical protein
MQQTKKRFWNAKRLKRGIIKKAKKAVDILNKFCHGRKARKRSSPFPSFCLLFFFLKNALSKKRQLLSTLGLKKGRGSPTEV